MTAGIQQAGPAESGNERKRKMRYRNLDPYWLNARFDSRCACGAAIQKGERIFYYPNGKRALCAKCGATASAEFEGAKQDEAFYASQY